MCGITGIYDISKKHGREKLKRMATAIASVISHRGPDSTGFWQDPDVPLALAHRRLAIIDLSDEGAQPMASASGRYIISYNGEIYNFQSLQRDLQAAGLKFRGRSDTEVILAAIDYWGLNLALQKINGMFAFALWDRREKMLHFVRDRLGKKPLYIGWARKFLVFGSELKALCEHPDFTPDLDRNALALFMRYSYIPAPHCIYKNVWSLLPGHWLSLKVEDLTAGEDLYKQMKPYWNAQTALQEAQSHPLHINDKATVAEFEHLLTQCTRERMISDVPLGAFLSGGIDSSAVVALMQKNSTRPVKTYTIGFEESGFNEAEYAQDVSRHLGTDHHELYLKGSDALNVIPKLQEIYDEPFADISGIPTYLISKFARQGVTVALTGDGGDEMLGGYNRHVEGPKIWNKVKYLPRPLRKILSEAILKTSTTRWDTVLSFIPQAGERVHKAGSVLSLRTEEEVYIRLLSRWSNPAALVKGAQEPEIPLTQTDWVSLKDLSFAEKMMFGDTLHYLPNDILVKTDRASMAVSLEVRSPLLDRRIYEYVWRLRAHAKIRNGKGKWLLRRVLARHMPEELFERPKQGFTIPVGAWLRGSLKDWAEGLLDEKRLREDGLLDASLIRQSWESHQKGQGNNAEMLWTVLMFQAWKERWL